MSAAKESEPGAGDAELKLDSELTPALFALSKSLDEWAFAGADSLVVVRDIVRLIRVVNAAPARQIKIESSSDSGASR